MPWGDKDHSGGPWGSPPGGGGGGGGNSGGSGGGNRPPGGPDFDDLVRRSLDGLRDFFPGNSGNNRKTVALVGAVAALLWLSSGIYFVKADEQGVVMRFGAYHHTTGSGLNYHLPYPIETVETPRVTTINHVEIGFRSATGRAGKTADGSSDESLMLTGDENILDIDFEVQWKISNAPDYLFNVRNPEETVKSVSESAMREVIGQSQIAMVLAEGKLRVAQDTRKLIQDILNSYKAGIEVLSVNLLKADPPAEVLDAQRDVQTALADMETARNQAEAYHNDVVPRARGEAQKLILDAEAYKQEVINRAQGEASRFVAVNNEYKQARDVTRKRMFLETMEDVLQGMNKVIVDKGSNGVVPYLPLQELRNRGEEAK
jgi:membrane protease subunit HflK